jgi:hypothetical protein
VVLLAPGQIWTSLFFTVGFVCEKSCGLRVRRRGCRGPRPRSPVAAATIRKCYSRLCDTETITIDYERISKNHTDPGRCDIVCLSIFGA